MRQHAARMRHDDELPGLSSPAMTSMLHHQLRCQCPMPPPSSFLSHPPCLCHNNSVHQYAHHRPSPPPPPAASTTHRTTGRVTPLTLPLRGYPPLPPPAATLGGPTPRPGTSGCRACPGPLAPPRQSTAPGQHNGTEQAAPTGPHNRCRRPHQPDRHATAHPGPVAPTLHASCPAVP